MGSILDGTEIVLGSRVGKGSYGEVFKAEWRGITVAGMFTETLRVFEPSLRINFTENQMVN